MVPYARWTNKDGPETARLIMAKSTLGPILEKEEVGKNEISAVTFRAE